MLGLIQWRGSPGPSSDVFPHTMLGFVLIAPQLGTGMGSGSEVWMDRFSQASFRGGQSAVRPAIKWVDVLTKMTDGR